MDPLNVAWKNFRGFQDTTSMQFPAITLFIGSNNVGKSSAYAPLLILKQTLGARDPRTALLSRGDIIDAGPYEDFVSRHDLSKKVTFSVDTGLGTDFYAGGYSRSFGGAHAKAVEMTFESIDGVHAQLYRHTLLDSDGVALVTRTRQKAGHYLVRSPLLPEATSVGRPVKEVSELRRGMREEQPIGFQFSGFGGLLLPRKWRENQERWARVRDWYNAASDIFEIYEAANRGVAGLLTGVSYLGPLRALPNRTYRLAAERPTDVGITGEHAPEILFRDRGDILGEATNQWLSRLGYGSLDFQEIAEDYFQMFTTQRDGLRINVAHSGVGLSQLLPLVVQGLSLRPSATLIAQQPEIHLNPAQQSIMTDFLIDVAAADRRVLVETHSEHVLLRLRRRIAEGTLDAKTVAVYFFEIKHGRSVPRRINIDAIGGIDREEWPSGFFEDQLNDSFALAMAQARAAQ